MMRNRLSFVSRVESFALQVISVIVIFTGDSSCLRACWRANGFQLSRSCMGTNDVLGPCTQRTGVSILIAEIARRRGIRRSTGGFETNIVAHGQDAAGWVRQSSQGANHFLVLRWS